MTKTEAIYKFFNKFGVKAYPATSVPEVTEFPWITYSTPVSNAGEPSVSATVDIWYHSESEKGINDKVDEISKAIGLSGVTVPYDGGMIWITRGVPWCIPIDENDMTIKRRQLNVEIEYL